MKSLTYSKRVLLHYFRLALDGDLDSDGIAEIEGIVEEIEKELDHLQRQIDTLTAAMPQRTSE